MRPLIVVSYRDRLVHLECFKLYMAKHFSHIPIVVVQQADNDKWNKGLLYNAGYIECHDKCDYIILSDVDFIPNPGVDYSYPELPTLISTECSQFGYTHMYDTFFGGVVAIRNDHYELVNGFPNLYRGYGGEDDAMFRRVKGKGLVPQKRLGNRFECFEHPRPKQPDDYNYNLMLLNNEPNYSDGLTTAQYKVVSRHESGNYTHLKIDTRP